MNNLNNVYRVYIDHISYAIDMVQTFSDHISFSIKNKRGQRFDLDVYEEDSPRKILSWECGKGVAFRRVHEVGFDSFQS